MREIKNYINGSLVSFSKNYLDVYDPSTGEVISKVVLSNKKDFDEVIHSSVSSRRE